MRESYYTYILRCNDGNRYFGHTINLKERLKEHLTGKVLFTKNKQVELIYFAEFDTRSKAFRREMQLKNGRTRKGTVDKLIHNFNKAKCQGFNSQTLIDN